LAVVLCLILHVADYALRVQTYFSVLMIDNIIYTLDIGWLEQILSLLIGPDVLGAAVILKKVLLTAMSFT